jgi:hypothetical protein
MLKQGAITETPSIVLSGHDAWIVGDKRCVILNFMGVAWASLDAAWSGGSGAL